MLYHLPRWYGAGRTSIFAEIFLSEQSENTVSGPLLAALQVIREHKCDCVADTRNGFADNPEDTKWVADYFMPTASEYGCRTIFFIIDKQEENIMIFIWYPKCSTCQKAKKWLDEHKVEYSERHIVDENPTYDELKEWYGKSGLPLKKFFNTSGLLYKEMQLKEKLPAMSEDEQLRLLATNGMLVKRPLIVMDDTVLVGFKEKEWGAEDDFLQR